MNKGWWVAAGAGAGAALMYVFDPDRGRRRRAGLRDKVRHAARSAGTTVEVCSRRFGQRLHGLAARSRPRLPSEAVPDEVLAERVRSQIGHASGHAHGLHVAVRDGRVTLSGSISGGEVRRVMKRVCRVPGVEDVVNELEVYEHRLTAS